MAAPAAPQFTREEWMEIAWAKGPPEIAEDSRKVLENYSQVPPEEVVDHVTKIREKGFNIFPYPCIGQWRFLHLALGRHFLYDQVLQRMLSGNETFLDLGCAFAQDIRRLVADGVDSSKCYGTDLRLQFLDLGYELFRDKDSLKTKFIEADVFVEDNALNELHGKVDIINASSFFHLFSWDEQKKVAHRCVKLWSSRAGSLLVGRHVGNEQAEEITTRAGGSRVYRHNVESWHRLWNDIGAETGLAFRVEARLADQTQYASNTGLIFGREEGTRIMSFSVERVDQASS